MTVLVLPTSTYEKQVARLLSAEERRGLEAHLTETPELHPVIPGTGGVRKARWRRGSHGKRGGVRVLYYFALTARVIVLVGIYAKSRKEDLTDADKAAIRKAVEHFKRSL